MLLYTCISQFSVAPHYQQQLYLRPSLVVFFNFSHKRPTFAFTPESGYTLAFQRKIAHKGTHAETGVFWMGVVSLPSDRFARIGNLAWPGGRTANFAAFGSWPGGAPKERRKPSEQRCAYACRCPEGVAAPLGCVIFFASAEIAVCTSCAQAFCVCEAWVVSLPSARFTCC